MDSDLVQMLTYFIDQILSVINIIMILGAVNASSKMRRQFFIGNLKVKIISHFH